jgi:hypothetical protein
MFQRSPTIDFNCSREQTDTQHVMKLQPTVTTYIH